ncbi:MAG: extensin-like domain-containing protein [Hasllibacter sp.]
MIRPALIACLAAAPAFAQDAQDAPAEPPENPVETSPAPTPRPDPEQRLDVAPLDEVDAQTSEGPTVQEPPTEGPGIAAELAESPEDLAECLAALEATGAVFEAVPAISEADDDDCGIVNPLALSELPGGIVLAPVPTLRCEAALATARWASGHLGTAAEVLGRGAITRINTGTGYMCRRRNNTADGPLSEHAFGNGIDVMSFEFAEGEPLPIEPRADEGTLAEAFQRVARATSCLHFTTVLGPGADGSHDDHLHMDVKQRRGGYRLCQ